jgi:pyrroline-5-carboxylate reductase
MRDTTLLAFIGGGNMASAILGGLRRSGMPAEAFLVVEPMPAQRERLASEFGIQAIEAVDASVTRADLVVWAVKPQLFAEASAPCAGQLGGALHLSVMAGIRSDALVKASGSERVVRAMPNTPALIGRGVAGLFARAAVTEQDRALIEQVMTPTGARVWVSQESDLDAVTALSGSGPAYVFYFIEAMVQAGVEMGLDAAQARQLAQDTFAGAAALAAQSAEPVEVLRDRVTSKGGTTYAALTSMEASGMKSAFVQALHAARDRAEELGR